MSGGCASGSAAALHSDAEIFAANRASGHIGLAVAARGGRTRRTRVHEAGSLRVRFPNARRERWKPSSSTPRGGMAGGDRFAIEIALGEGASLMAGTAAAEKIYRSIGAADGNGCELDVGAGARLAWLPQETILFDRARLARRIEVDLAADASLLMAEAVVFGRSAMGEAVEEGFFADRWRVRRGGRLVFAENARLDGAIADKLARRRSPPAAWRSPPCWWRRRTRRRCRRGARARICRRGRRLGLERHRGGAAVAPRRRCLAPRSDRRAGGARRSACRGFG